MKNKDIYTYLENIKPKYEYYFDDKKADPYKTQPLNCSDEICPGSHERTQKIRTLRNKKVRIGDQNFMREYGKIVQEMHKLFQEEFIAISDCSEHEANLWIEANINFNHVKQTEDTKGNKYLSVDPVIGNKYVGFNPQLKKGD